jgi:hypothetical protein
VATKDEVTEEFNAEGESGNVYRVVKIQTLVSSPTTSGHGAWKKGSHHFELDSGESVNQISETKFEIVWLDRADNEIITRT